MEYLKIKEVAQKWEISPRAVQILCADGRVEGAVRFGRVWMIPKNAQRPVDGRSKAGRDQKDLGEGDMPMPRKTPFLYMTDLYNTPGTADEMALTLDNHHEARVLFEAEVAYSRGQIDKVYDSANYLLNKHSGFYAVISAGMLLAQCAIWRGDLALWQEAKKHICEAPCKDAHDRELLSLSLAIIDSTVYDNKDYPEWFRSGNFEALLGDAHPAAKVFYVKHLYMTAYAVATKQEKREGISGLALMRILPQVVEPMISQAVLDKTILPEMYLRMSCAVSYYNAGLRDRAVLHIDRAVRLALADGMYGFLAEYLRHFEDILLQRIALVDEAAAEAVRLLSSRYSGGWARLSGRVRERVGMVADLDATERQIVKLCAFGYTNKEIAAMLYISESGVSHAITRILNKTGLMNKRELAVLL